jgi:5-methylcytosine-specific restriction endonuclease McrA
MPFNRKLYPANWREIRTRILERAGSACECRGECGSEHDGGRCNAPNGVWIVRHETDPRRWRSRGDVDTTMCEDGCGGIRGYEGRLPVKVVLTCAHLDRDTGTDESRIIAACQRCHLKLDASQHASTARRNRFARYAVGTLRGIE